MCIRDRICTGNTGRESTWKGRNSCGSKGVGGTRPSPHWDPKKSWFYEKCVNCFGKRVRKWLAPIEINCSKKSQASPLPHWRGKKDIFSVFIFFSHSVLWFRQSGPFCYGMPHICSLKLPNILFSPKIKSSVCNTRNYIEWLHNKINTLA